MPVWVRKNGSFYEVEWYVLIQRVTEPDGNDSRVLAATTSRTEPRQQQVQRSKFYNVAIFDRVISSTIGPGVKE